MKNYNSAKGIFDVIVEEISLQNLSTGSTGSCMESGESKRYRLVCSFTSGDGTYKASEISNQNQNKGLYNVLCVYYDRDRNSGICR